MIAAINCLLRHANPGLMRAIPVRRWILRGWIRPRRAPPVLARCVLRLAWQNPKDGSSAREGRGWEIPAGVCLILTMGTMLA